MKPNKTYGQNFLKSPAVAERMVDAAEISSADLVLEIGPGKGALTEKLLVRARQVFAVEKDERLVFYLTLKFKDEFKNNKLVIIGADILKFDPAAVGLQAGGYKIVANIPYSISSYLLNDYLQNSPRPSEMILMLQKEVAQRAIAKASDSERSLLSLVVELFSKKAEIVQIVPSAAFWPEPKVESAILRIIIDPDVETQGIASVQSILHIAKIAFSQRRKKIANSLPVEICHGISLRSDIDLNLRPQDLTLDQWKIISTL